jgi:hypothetical protein
MPGAPDGQSRRALSRAALAWALLFLALAAARLCHSGVLWAEEALPLAAASQMARGAVLYRDIWFDKPPLLAAVYLLWGARAGWLPRVAGALYALGICALAWAFARRMWGAREARWAAGLAAFCLTFYIPSAVVPLAADLLMVAPHLAAVYLAWRGRWFFSGVVAGLAFLINPKGLFVLAACAVWGWRGLVPLAAGFAAVNAGAAAWLWWQGALGPYWDQVWRWGRIYAGGTFVAEPLRNAAGRTLAWMGFHAALVFAAAAAWPREKQRWQWAAWALLSAAATAAGWRFFPRYFFQLLPVLVLLGARGFVLLGPRRRWYVAALLLVPLVRFGPRYPLLAMGERNWADTAMDRDSRTASALVRQMAQPGDTIFVWGFRPEMYVYTGLPAASRFLDSQPLTGVPADRHLTQSAALAPALAQANRTELARSTPAFILDGLGPYNPKLAITAYPDLRAWLEGYEPAARTHETVIYRRRR